MTRSLFETTAEELSLSEVFGMLSSHGVTGTMTSIHGNTVKKIYFFEGKIAFASSSRESDQLDSILVQLGKLDPERHAAIIKRLQHGGMKAANVLFENHIITPEELLLFMRYQVLRIIYSLFVIKAGKIEVEFGEFDETAILRLNIRGSDLALEAARYFLTDEQIHEILNEDSHVLVRTAFYDSFIDAITLTPGEAVLCRLIDDSRNLRRLCELSPFARAVTRRILAAFCLLRLTESKAP